MLLSKQPLNRTEIFNSVETSVNSDGEHSKSLADEEGDYAEASELYSRSLEIREESEGKLKGILGCTEDDVVSTDFEGDSRLLPNFQWISHSLSKGCPPCYTLRGTTTSFWDASEHSIGIATWCWKMFEKCGQRYQILGKVRRNLSQLNKDWFISKLFL